MRSPFRRHGGVANPGKTLGRPIALLESGEDDGWSEARLPPQSGVWIVVKLPTSVEEGDWRRRGYTPAGYSTWMREADTGLEAIQQVYKDQFDRLDKDKREKADGRYVALDFYGGHRVEALVTGDWKVDIALAPEALGPPR